MSAPNPTRMILAAASAAYLPPLPPWIFPVARFLLGILIVLIGVKGWADGYGFILVTIGTSMIAAELAGAGISRNQAQAIAEYIVSLEKQAVGGYVPHNSSPNPPSPPVQ